MDLYTDDDIDMVNASSVEFIECAECDVDLPIDGATVNPDGDGYLCPFCDGTFG